MVNNILSRRLIFATSLLISIVFTSLIHAEVKATIDRNPVRVNETFELVLHMNSSPVDKPELRGFPSELEIMRSSNFYQSSTINGKTSVQAGWRYTIKAKAEGIFTIPSFVIEGTQTAAMQIKVLPAVSATTIAGQPDAIRLTASVDQDNVYVQQQIIYTIQLYRAVQAQYASLTEPSMEGAILERLGEDKQFETQLDGVRYIVLERKFVLFPQQKGEQLISPVVFTAEVSDGAKRYSSIGRLRSRTKTVSLSTKAINITVKGRAAGIVDWWLPATQVTLTEQWLPSPVNYRVGEPVTWNYTIKATGVTATQLPEILPVDVDGLKFYPDNAVSDNQISTKGITGIRTQSIAVVPTKSGDIELPEIKLNWWDISKNQSQELVLPARTIKVLPALGTDNKPLDGKAGQIQNISEEQETSNSVLLTGNNHETDENSSNFSKIENVDNKMWKMIAIISLLLWLISALILTIKNRNSVVSRSKRSLSRNTSSHSFSGSISDIKSAAKNKSATKLKSTILLWCKGQKSLGSIRSLSALARELSNHTPLTQQTECQLAFELKRLESHLYAKSCADTQQQWNAQPLIDSLADLKLLTTKQTKQQSDNNLPPLHLTES